MAARFVVTAWKPVLMVCTEHLEWQDMHWRKKSRVSLFKMVSGERQVWQMTYSLMYLLSTFSMCFCWNLPFITSWLFPSMAPVVPNSANKKASKCLGIRWSLKLERYAAKVKKKTESRARNFLHFGNFGKVDKGRLLCSDFDHLRRPHDEFLGAAFHRVGILVLDDDEDSLQKFVIGVVPIFSVPSTAWTFCHIFYNSRKVKLNTIFRQVKV